MFLGSFKIDIGFAMLIGLLAGAILPTWAAIVTVVVAVVVAILVAGSGNGIGAEGLVYVYIAALMIVGLAFVLLANIFFHPDFANLLLRIQGKK